nr:hypothetical protein [Endozoicomonas sp.]
DRVKGGQIDRRVGTAYYGRTLLMIIVCGFEDSDKDLELAYLILEKGASVFAKNSAGESVLDIARERQEKLKV